MAGLPTARVLNALPARFDLLHSRSSAAEFHARPLPDPVSPEIWWHEIDRPALVLGSTQSEEVVDTVACTAAGIDVVRRRSGGGAVLLVPGEVTWIDVIVPTGTEGWGNDVHTPMKWLGERLATVLRGLIDEQGGDGGGDERYLVEVHHEKMVSTAWSRLICFDGRGAGEVTLAGEKLIGISQRRTRAAARLQCCWYSRYDPQQMLALLAAGVRPRVGDLQPVATIDEKAAAEIPAALLALLNAQLGDLAT